MTLLFLKKRKLSFTLVHKINTSKDKILNSKINFDFSEINNPTKEVNYDKIIAYGF